MNKFEQRIQTIFRGKFFEAYREFPDRVGSGPFIEFWFRGPPDGRHDVTFRDLQRLSDLLRTERITTATYDMNEGNPPCMHTKTDYAVYVLAEGVEF